MGLFGTKKADERPTGMVLVEVDPAQAPTSQVRTSEPVTHASARVGIDHAIQLMRSLPTDRNVQLVVTVLKTTLESLGIRVSDIILDAGQRQKDLSGRVTVLKTEIEGLEKEIELRAEEIERLEAAHAETTKVRDYLEGGDEVPIQSSDLLEH